MNAAERKLKVLEAVVESYINFGEPVGSKAVCAMLDFPVSSATIRNDMAELSEMGYILQPHTSAGRIPSETGYRLYINKIIKLKELSQEQKDYIYQELENSGDEPGYILKKASDLISDITGCASAATTPSGNNSRIHRIKFVQTGRFTCMLVLITSSGMVKNRLFRCDFVITPEIIALFDKILNERLAGLLLTDLTPAFIQTTAASLGQLVLLMPNVFKAVNLAAEEAVESNVFISGQTGLILLDDYSQEKIGKLVTFISSKKEIIKLFDLKKDSFKLLIGRENKIEELDTSCVIVKKYNISEDNFGTIGFIGPMRTNYSLTIPLIKYISETVENLIKLLIDV